jgi:hypothetical protein
MWLSLTQTPTILDGCTSWCKRRGLPPALNDYGKLDSFVTVSAPLARRRQYTWEA